MRVEVPDAIARCVDAGIRVVMITGDHPATATAVARAVGLPGTRWCSARSCRMTTSACGR